MLDAWHDRLCGWSYLSLDFRQQRTFMALNPWDAVCGGFGFKQLAAAPVFAARISVELPMWRALRSMALGRLPRVRAREGRMDRPHCQARHTHCVEIPGALFA